MILFYFLLMVNLKLCLQYEDPVPQNPIVVKPQHETQSVQLGQRYDLNCMVFVQSESYLETAVYWLMNYSYVDDLPQFNVSKPEWEPKDNGFSCQSNLSLEAQTEYLYIPFICIAMNPKGKDSGTVILLPAAQRSEPYAVLTLLPGFLLLALGLMTFRVFKVDLVLAYRNFSPCLKRQNDGKLYDAYVCCLHGDETLPSAASFMLNVLPKVLEDHVGYRLFISGRDELPGAAVHDVIAETVGMSRRLIIVLTPQAFDKPSNSTTIGLLHRPEESLSLSNNEKAIYPNLSELSDIRGLSWGPYECWIGVYDALVRGGLKVILVQVEGKVDEALMPESLRYISRKQGILKWKQDYSTKPNGKFWKQLRYLMPPVQKAKLTTVL